MGAPVAAALLHYTILSKRTRWWRKEAESNPRDPLELERRNSLEFGTLFGTNKSIRAGKNSFTGDSWRSSLKAIKADVDEAVKAAGVRVGQVANHGDNNERN